VASVLGARVNDLIAWRPRPLAAEGAYRRVDRGLAQAMPARAMRIEAPTEQPQEPDEIDRLFGFGS
jgi:hypothetical protein